MWKTQPQDERDQGTERPQKITFLEAKIPKTLGRSTGRGGQRPGTFKAQSSLEGRWMTAELEVREQRWNRRGRWGTPSSQPRSMWTAPAPKEVPEAESASTDFRRGELGFSVHPVPTQVPLPHLLDNCVASQLSLAPMPGQSLWLFFLLLKQEETMSRSKVE